MTVGLPTSVGNFNAWAEYVDKNNLGLNKNVKVISFPEIVAAREQAGNSIAFDKIMTVLPKGYAPESGKKGDLGKLLDKYNINDVVVNMYRDKSGANDLKRLRDLGFEVQEQYLGEPQGKIPSRDYYHLKRAKK